MSYQKLNDTIIGFYSRKHLRHSLVFEKKKNFFGEEKNLIDSLFSNVSRTSGIGKKLQLGKLYIFII